MRTSALPWYWMILAPLFLTPERSGLSVLMLPKNGCSAMPCANASASWPYVRFRQPFWPFDTALVNAGVAIAGFCSSSAVMSDEIENGLAPASPLLAPRVNPYQSWLLVRLAL